MILNRHPTYEGLDEVPKKKNYRKKTALIRFHCENIKSRKHMWIPKKEIPLKMWMSWDRER